MLAKSFPPDYYLFSKAIISAQKCKIYYSNLSAFTGVILVTNMVGITKKISVTTNVAIFSNKTVHQLISIGAVLR